MNTDFDEVSYGIIPLKQSKQGWMIFLVQLHAGHWGFPKGHTEKGETPLETATRELTEETGLSICRLLDQEMLRETYHYLRNSTESYKMVGYFIAEVEGTWVKQEAEIADAKWVPLSEAENIVNFAEAKIICQRLNKQFSQNT